MLLLFFPHRNKKVQIIYEIFISQDFIVWSEERQNFSSGWEELLLAINNNGSEASGRFKPHLTLKRYTTKTMGWNGMKASGWKETNLGAAWIRTVGKIFLDFIFLAVELKFKIRMHCWAQSQKYVLTIAGYHPTSSLTPQKRLGFLSLFNLCLSDNFVLPSILGLI